MICLCNNWSVFRLGCRIEVGAKTDYNKKFVPGILGHMTKMAATLIYGKKPSKILSGTTEPITTKLGMKHWGLQLIIVYSNDDPWLTMTYFTTRSNLVT